MVVTSGVVGVVVVVVVVVVATPCLVLSVHVAIVLVNPACL